MIPQDPFILVSYLNTKLRDFYPDLDSMCKELSLDKEEIEEKMQSADFVYDPQSNQFV